MGGVQGLPGASALDYFLTGLLPTGSPADFVLALPTPPQGGSGIENGSIARDVDGNPAKSGPRPPIQAFEGMLETCRGDGLVQNLNGGLNPVIPAPAGYMRGTGSSRNPERMTGRAAASPGMTDGLASPPTTPPLRGKKPIRSSLTEEVFHPEHHRPVVHAADFSKVAQAGNRVFGARASVLHVVHQAAGQLQTHREPANPSCSGTGRVSWSPAGS